MVARAPAPLAAVLRDDLHEGLLERALVLVRSGPSVYPLEKKDRQKINDSFGDLVSSVFFIKTYNDFVYFLDP